MERRCGDHCPMCKSKTVGEADETRSWLGSLAGKSYLDRNVIADGAGRDRHREGWGGILDRAVEDCGVRLGVRVEDDGNPRDLRCDLLEQLKPFCHPAARCSEPSPYRRDRAQVRKQSVSRASAAAAL